MEVKRYKGRIVTKDRFVLDQLAEEDDKWYWSGKGSFTIHVKKTYGLNPQQYYNLVVFGDVNEIPTCPYCGKEIPFRNLNKGYPAYCSHWCSSSSDITKKNRFLAYGYASARIYVARLRDTDNKMKLGVTGRSWNVRQSYQGHYLYDHQYLIEGDPEFIIDLELKLDKKFCDSNELFDTTDLDKLISEVNLAKGSTTIPDGSTLK